MSKKIDVTAEQIGDVLIDISDLLKTKMEKWSDVPKRPHNLSIVECVGFITKESSAARLDLVLDIQAPINTNKAILRIWGIESKLDNNNNERFNNIVLNFDMDYATARTFTQKGDTITRDDIRTALHEPNTRLSRVIVSNQSGSDENSQQLLGERYDLTIDEKLDQDKDFIDKVNDTLIAVSSALKNSATA